MAFSKTNQTNTPMSRTDRVAVIFFVTATALFILWIINTNAATTIGANIQTDGTASSTSATTTAYLYVGPSITVPAGWDYAGGDLVVSDDAFFNSQATTSVSLWVGSAGTPGNLDLANGDLYVQGDAEIDGILYLDRASSTSATTTAYLYVGPNITVPAGWDYAGGDLVVSDDLFVNSQATTSASLWVGSAGTPGNLDLASGDLYVQGDAEIDGTLYLDRASSTSATTTDYLYVGPDGTEDATFDFSGGDLFVADELNVGGVTKLVGFASTTADLAVSGGTFDVTTSTATTTPGIFSRDNTTATSTVSIGDEGRGITGCIELLTSAGTYARAIIDGTVWNIAAGRCN